MDISIMYSEVFGILEILGKEYIDKIPQKLYKYIESKKSNKILVEYDVTKPIKEQKISKETLEFISYLNLQYWCDEKEKNELIKTYKNNDRIFEKYKKEKYNPNELFSKKYREKNVELVKNNTKNPIKEVIHKIINKIFSRKL